LYIFDEAGFPTANNKFVFNGDFVDRGEKGLEIVVILFAFYVAEGHSVVCLNRGNHEDIAVCRVYGFEAEVKEKYDDLLFEMIAEVFNFIPLFSLVNKSVFVVHGGLFHTPNVDLEVRSLYCYTAILLYRYTAILLYQYTAMLLYEYTAI
jgi:serine/threonine-protein phosphatase 5